MSCESSPLDEAPAQQWDVRMSVEADYLKQKTVIKISLYFLNVIVYLSCTTTFALAMAVEGPHGAFRASAPSSYCLDPKLPSALAPPANLIVKQTLYPDSRSRCRCGKPNQQRHAMHCGVVNEILTLFGTTHIRTTTFILGTRRAYSSSDPSTKYGKLHLVLQ